jgi:hypothetical protein
VWKPWSSLLDSSVSATSERSSSRAASTCERVVLCDGSGVERVLIDDLGMTIQ